MGRIYTARFTPTSTTVARDLFEVLAAASVPVFVHAWHLFQTTDLGDSEEETAILETVRGVGASSGSGGNAAAEFTRDVNDAAAVAAIETFNDTRMTAGGGSVTTLTEVGWNIRLPWDHVFPPELRPRVEPGELWTLSLVGVPNDSIDIGGTIWVEEG